MLYLPVKSFACSTLRDTGIQILSGYTAAYRIIVHWVPKKKQSRITQSLPNILQFVTSSIKSLNHKQRGRACVPQRTTIVDRNPIFFLVHWGTQEFGYCWDAQKQNNWSIGKTATTTNRPKKTELGTVCSSRAPWKTHSQIWYQRGPSPLLDRVLVKLP